MTYWILKGRTPEKCDMLGRILFIAKNQRLGDPIREETLKTQKGEVRVSTSLQVVTWGDEPVFESIATGPGAPSDLLLKPFENKTYADAVNQHAWLVQRIKSNG